MVGQVICYSSLDINEKINWKAELVNKYKSVFVLLQLYRLVIKDKRNSIK